MGVTNSVVCGIFKPSIADYKELKGVPNVFLKIGQHVIDNTYLHQTEKATQKTIGIGRGNTFFVCKIVLNGRTFFN